MELSAFSSVKTSSRTSFTERFPAPILGYFTIKVLSLKQSSSIRNYLVKVDRLSYCN